MDGYKLSNENRAKKGRATAETAELYNLYHQNLVEQFADVQNCSVVRSDSHLGFAYAVKLGLEHCQTSYALVAQHDRVFYDTSAIFTRLNDLISAMESNKHIRYIGFPTNSNKKHDKLLSVNYKLDCLNKEDVKLDLGKNLYLQPLAFWFDSQHLCHVERYLQIFQPYKHLPINLRKAIGLPAVKDMLLKNGDFIEDRFGQIQRKLLCSFAAIDTEESRKCVVQLFKWFGTYLCWQSSAGYAHNYEVLKYSTEKCEAVVMVGHLRGRVVSDTRAFSKVQRMLLVSEESIIEST